MVGIEAIMEEVNRARGNTDEDFLEMRKVMIYGILTTFYQQNPHENRLILGQAFNEICTTGEICYKFVASKKFINLL